MFKPEASPPVDGSAAAAAGAGAAAEGAEVGSVGLVLLGWEEEEKVREVVKIDGKARRVYRQ